jgi:signal transduction histidine kinase/ligand-binding sensor domain-containing protein
MILPYQPARKYLCFLIFALMQLLHATAFAQLNPRYLTQYTELDGVPGSQVFKVLPDKLGYIWVGTINGLARYDGYEFKRYFNNPNDSTSIQGLIVWSIFEDHKGQIWAGCGPGFLNIYNPVTKSFRQKNFKDLIDHPANVEIGIRTMSEDNNGRIYFGVTSNYGEAISPGLLYLDEKDGEIKRFTGADSIQNINSITKDKDGNTWLLSYNGLFKIDAERKLSRINSLDKEIKKSTEYPTDINCASDGHIWIITQKSNLWDFNPVDSSIKIYSPGRVLVDNFDDNKITFDKSGNIWMGTRSGLLSFNRATRLFEFFKNESPNQLEKAPMLDLKFDSFGALWIGTVTQGLLKYEERAVFKSYSSNKDDENTLTPGWANVVYEAHDGKIWITTAGGNAGGVNELNLQTNTIRAFPYRSLLPGTYNISGLVQTTPGELLLSTNRGTYQMSTKTNALQKIMLNGVPDSIPINQFYKDSRDNLWLCTLSGLYKKTKGTEMFSRYNLSTLPGSNATSNEVTHAVESKKNGLWVTTNNGLFLYNYTTDKIERHGFDQKAGDIFITQDINSFYEDSAGIAWVGTWQGGLSMYNVATKKIKTFTRNDGLPSMSIQAILADKKNNTLWLSTFDGLSRFDLKTKQFNNFSITDGIQSQLFADGSNLITNGGLFIFGGSNGITIFNPKDINKNSNPPKVFLTDFKLFNKSVIPGEKSILKKPIDETKEIVLAYNQNSISLEFIALHYSNPSKNRYTYKLENYDNEWRDVGNQHVAFYPNLPPGEYLFHVKAANSNGVWNEEGATLKITVNAPWWRTTWAYIAYLLLLIAASFAVNRYLRSRLIEKERERSRAKELEQAKEIEKAYHSLEQTHEALKATQTQLIQSEKMASLGELTAGIAHEIQNPLNFVNNFSEVNTELIEELKNEKRKEKSERDDVLETDLLNNIEENEKKINHHGKRADAIVKGMLQHSRSSIAQKERTDINALADEYLRLAYHGLRAKDKSFNATLKTDYDETIGLINIVPQDIGRVILNLINNAFYAVSEKQKAESLLQKAYEPIVSVSTKRINDKVEIKVSDNGNGIPQKVLDKIFQPFFTTKPTGQGTGLGLSLSYDIVKAHSGEITVATKEGEGSEFIIQLPIV